MGFGIYSLGLIRERMRENMVDGGEGQQGKASGHGGLLVGAVAD